MTREEAIKWLDTDTYIEMCAKAESEGKLIVECLEEANQLAIEALRQGDWIPCSILPQEKDLSVDGMVLVQEKDTQRIFKGWYENIEGYNHWFDEMGFTMDAVMWCRLPEPYKGE